MTADPSPPVETLTASVERIRSLSRDGHDAQVIAAVDEVLADEACDAAGAGVARAQALALKAQSLSRQGRFGEAIEACASAPRDLSGPGHIEARVRVLLDMGYACTHRSQPGPALKMAHAALRIALLHGLTPLAAESLECAGVCHAMQGDLARADRLMHEGLGLALQTGDDAVVHRCLNNLLYLSLTLFDARRGEGALDGARFALGRCARFVARGDRLAPRLGAYERCQWRSNRAGWQLRRGSLDEARAAFIEVEREASAHGWALLVAFAQLDLASLHCEQGREIDALAVLDDVLQAGPAIDRYDLRMRAHQLARDILSAQGRPVDAAAHRLAHERLGRERAAERAQTATWLPQLGDGVLLALAQADRVRLDGGSDELRRERIDAHNAAFLGVDWMSDLS